MVEGVVPDEVAARGDVAGQLRERLDPPTLQEERGLDVLFIEHVEHALGPAGAVRAIGMLGVEGQRDPEGHRRITFRRR